MWSSDSEVGTTAPRVPGLRGEVPGRCADWRQPGFNDDAQLDATAASISPGKSILELDRKLQIK